MKTSVFLWGDVLLSTCRPLPVVFVKLILNTSEDLSVISVCRGTFCSLNETFC